MQPQRKLDSLGLVPNHNNNLFTEANVGIYNTHNKYGTIAKAFHWLMALLIIGMLVAGSLMTDMTNSPLKFQIYGIHKALGITLLGMFGLRLIWRFMNESPPMPPHSAWFEVLGAKSAHFGLYVLMLAMPMSGWAMSSAAGFPISYFGLFTVPNLIAPDKELMKLAHDAHEYLGYAFMAVLVAHIAGAFYHHFYKKDNVLTRMLPWQKDS